MRDMYGPMLCVLFACIYFGMCPPTLGDILKEKIREKAEEYGPWVPIRKKHYKRVRDQKNDHWRAKKKELNLPINWKNSQAFAAESLRFRKIDDPEEIRLCNSLEDDMPVDFFIKFATIYGLIENPSQFRLQMKLKRARRVWTNPGFMEKPSSRGNLKNKSKGKYLSKQSRKDDSKRPYVQRRGNPWSTAKSARSSTSQDIPQCFGFTYLKALKAIKTTNYGEVESAIQTGVLTESLSSIDNGAFARGMADIIDSCATTGRSNAISLDCPLNERRNEQFDTPPMEDSDLHILQTLKGVRTDFSRKASNCHGDSDCQQGHSCCPTTRTELNFHCTPTRGSGVMNGDVNDVCTTPDRYMRCLYRQIRTKICA